MVNFYIYRKLQKHLNTSLSFMKIQIPLHLQDSLHHLHLVVEQFKDVKGQVMTQVLSITELLNNVGYDRQL